MLVTGGPYESASDIWIAEALKKYGGCETEDT
jgi:hypothetical protein